jgi:hypothetical protein
LKDNYQPIVDRNPFGLRPPPPPPTNNVTTPVKDKPKTEIFLTGITSIGSKRAYLMTKEAAGKKEPTYYTLSEGIERDGIKVLSIDEVARKVRVHTVDEGELILSFQTHGVPPPVGGAVPGKPGQPGLQPGQPGYMPQPVGQPQAIAPGSLPGNAIPMPQVNNAGVPTTTIPATRQIPSRRVRSGSVNNAVTPNVGGGGFSGPGNPTPQPDVDPAEQYIRMHLNRTAAQKDGIAMPPLPIVGQ